MNASYKRYWEPGLGTTMALSLGTGWLTTYLTYPLNFIKTVVQYRNEGVGMRGNNVWQMGTNSGRLMKQMHSNGGGYSKFYVGYQAHLHGRLTYLAIRNFLYKIIYDRIKPAKPSNDLTIRQKMVLAGAVGGFAALITTPFELVSVRQICDTQLPKDLRRNYGSIGDSWKVIADHKQSIWRGGYFNVYKHIMLNISLTGPYDYVHQRLWIVFGDYGWVKPIALVSAAAVGAATSLPFDNWRTKWMQSFEDPMRNRINAKTLLTFMDKCLKNEGSYLSPWVGYYPYFGWVLLYATLTVGITDTVTSALKRQHKQLQQWMM